MLLRVILVLITIITSSLCDVNPLLIEYYTKLITRGASEARSYSQRKDNSDFFRNVSDDTVHDYGTFDFIVVGAGAAGSVVATRLTEIENWKILLLEAGGELDDFGEIPGMTPFLPSSNRNWGFKSTPSVDACLAYENRQCPVLGGKILGGSSEINGMVYVRGNARNYDRWEELGNPGWSYGNVLKYFKKSENSQIPNGNGYHGFAGPSNIAYITPTTKFNRMFSDAFQELGFEELDYNGAHQIGVSQLQQRSRFGRRVSGGRSFVNAARNRINFNVTLQAYVTKIMIDEFSRTAYGVSFVRDGMKYKAIASKEVIISAGALSTPQLLMLSGIGPEQELRKHNIRLIRDLPVGKTFKAHASIRNLAFRTNTTLKVSLTELVEGYLEGRGSLTGSFGSISVSYVNMKERNNSLPDVEFVMLPPVGMVKELEPPMTYTKDISRGLSSLINIGSDFQIQPVILGGASVGGITLKSANPIDFPNIDLGFLTAEEDLENLFKAGRYMVNLSKTKAFRRLNATFLWKIEPCNKYKPNSRKFWYCTAKYFGFTYSHSTTARMGPPTDPLAVVNHELKVYGVRNLRIADCSIMPEVVSGHTNSAAFMIGEKAADMIKSQFGKS